MSSSKERSQICQWGLLWPHRAPARLSQVIVRRKNLTRKLTDTVQLKLRFSEALRRRLERAAKANDQSMNAEIIQRLEQSFVEQDQKQLMTSIAKESARKAAQTTLTILEGRFKTGVPPRRIEAQPEPVEPADTNQKGKAR